MDIVALVRVLQGKATDPALSTEIRSAKDITTVDSQDLAKQWQ